MSKIFQLVSRSSGGSHRCLCSRLEPTPTLIPKTTMDLDGQMSSPGNSAKNNSSSHCSIVAKPIDGNRSSKSSSTIRGSDNSRTKQAHSKDPPRILVDHLASLSQSFKAGGLSEQVCTLLLASWREKNNRSYQSAWKIWCGWCSARGMNGSP